MDQLNEEFKEEHRRTAECLADVQQFFSHDTSVTRRQLVEALRQRAAVIEAEISIDQPIPGFGTLTQLRS